jgi:hypothetical protein
VARAPLVRRLFACNRPDFAFVAAILCSGERSLQASSPL